MNYFDQLLEAISHKKAAEGTIPFLKSGLKDPIIQQMIDFVVKKTGKKKADIEKAIQKDIDDVANLKKKAPILYHTIAENVAEGTVFRLVSELEVEDAPKFNTTDFLRLWRRIQAEHKSLFQLRNFVSKESSVQNPMPIFIPDPRRPEFNNVDTACATPKAEFAFNKKFCQSLMNYAYLKKVVPKGKKYKSNGGDFEDAWCMIEFVILHEFYHYSYADFHYHKVYKADPTLVNWVGDFRSNYDLVKAGFEQLPIGLFNDKINLDRQKSWKEMYDIVEAEFKKLNKQEQQQVEDHLGDMENGQHQDQPGKPGEKGGKGGKGDQGKKQISVGDKVKLPDGSPGVVKSIENGKAKVERVAA